MHHPSQRLLTRSTRTIKDPTTHMTSEKLTPCPLVVHDDTNVSNNSQSPTLSDVIPSLPSTVPTSAHTSDFNTSVVNSPTTSPAQLDDQVEDRNLVMPMMELVSPDLADSSISLLDMTLDSDLDISLTLPFSDSDSLLISAHASPDHSSVTFATTDIYEPSTSTKESTSKSSASIEHITSTTDSALSVVSTSEYIHIADCSPRVNE
ncbi:hypothetical protein P692DRAFT_20879044 [Suillus brevipes Sb2]|nr:hypothetical protein P692DRAFT_20879044 [Suillus brevipes Sb2]